MQNANQQTQNTIEYCQCVVLAGMKPANIPRVQVNVDPHTHTEKQLCALPGADTSS